MPTVYFVRHGTTEWNLQGRWQGTTDTELAEAGVAQAEALGAHFRSAGVDFAAVFCSDLKRARATAKLLSAKGEIAAPALRECGFGEFQGLTKAEIFGPKYAALWAALPKLPHESRIRTAYFPGLETPLDVARRCVALARNVAAAHDDGDARPSCLVTHSACLEAVAACAFGAHYETAETDTCAWMKCDVPADPARPLRLLESSGVRFAPAPDAIPAGAPGHALCDPDGARRATASAARRLAAWAGLAVALAFSVYTVLLLAKSGSADAAAAEAAAAAAPAVEGYWGPPTASVNWCEADYVATPYVAEIWNALSSFLIAAAGARAVWALARTGAEAPWLGISVSLVAVGLGSVAFHGTLLKRDQALDEVPMLWLALTAAYALLEIDAGDDGPVHGTALPYALTAWAAAVSAAQWFVEGPWQPVAFHGSFASAELFFLYKAYALSRSAADPRTRALFSKSFKLYGAALVSWALDINACAALSALPVNPQLHAWGWHGCVALASHGLIVGGACERLARRGQRAYLDTSGVGGAWLPSIAVAAGGRAVSAK